LHIDPVFRAVIEVEVVSLFWSTSDHLIARTSSWSYSLILPGSRLCFISISTFYRNFNATKRRLNRVFAASSIKFSFEARDFRARQLVSENPKASFVEPEEISRSGETFLSSSASIFI
jgi:hypothetical protein